MSVKFGKFAVAVSAFALVTGAAHAQSGNNTSEVSQTGTNNRFEIDNARAGNANNRSTLVQNGRDNRATVVQISNSNASQIQQLGDRMAFVHTQDGNFNRVESFSIGNDMGSAVRQRGQDNSATVNQSGFRNLSQIAQGIEAAADRNFTFDEFYNPQVGAVRVGNDNRATVSQVGNDFTSNIRQRAAAGSTTPASNNVAGVLQRGAGNSASITQESRGNSAVVFQFEGGVGTGLRNTTVVTQGNAAATPAANPLSGNRVDVAVSGQNNSGTVTQNGLNNAARLTQGMGRGLATAISQIGSAGTNVAAVSQSGDLNAITVAQDSAGASASIWQQAGPAGGRSANNVVEVQQGTGTTGTAAFSSAFFGNAAPVVGAATRGLVADVAQGGNPAAVSWNSAQVRQDGTGLSAIVRQGGSGTAALPNIVRIGQQGGTDGANIAIVTQLAGVGASSAGDPASGLTGDEFAFAGGARSAEATILQSGSSNSATIEQRGLGQFARIEQGPGSANIASILQEVAATNATAIIRQTGSNNRYDVVQNAAGQYILVSQTGSDNLVTDVVRRP